MSGIQIALSSAEIVAALGFTPENAALKAQNSGYASLDSGGKVPVAQLPASIVGAMQYQGAWNASTNSPTLASGVGTQGHVRRVSTAGSTTLDGITSWGAGDYAVFNGTTWEKWEGALSAAEVNAALGYTAANAGALGVALGTSLSLGGATIGSNALAVTGTALFNAAVTVDGNLTFGVSPNQSFLSNPGAAGKFLFRNQAGTTGGVLDVSTDTTFKFLGRDGTTRAAAEVGTLSINNGVLGSAKLAVSGNVEFSGGLIVGSAISAGSTTPIGFTSRSSMYALANGNIHFGNNNDDGFTSLTMRASAGVLVGFYPCTGTPEGAITAHVGSLALRQDGGAATTLYVKESGTGNTGWVAK